MKFVVVFISIILFVSCTSNTVYKKPDDLIPKDSMLLLLEEMYIATAAKSYKNKYNQKQLDYVHLIYDKFKIDSTRFKTSNIYYTSKIDEYHDMIKDVKVRLENRVKELEKRDSTQSKNPREEHIKELVD